VCFPNRFVFRLAPHQSSNESGVLILLVAVLCLLIFPKAWPPSCGWLVKNTFFVFGGYRVLFPSSENDFVACCWLPRNSWSFFFFPPALTDKMTCVFEVPFPLFACGLSNRSVPLMKCGKKPLAIASALDLTPYFLHFFPDTRRCNPSPHPPLAVKCTCPIGLFAPPPPSFFLDKTCAPSSCNLFAAGYLSLSCSVFLRFF